MAAPFAPNSRNTPPRGARPAVQSNRVPGTPKPPPYHRLIPDLRAGEEIVMLQRQHPAVLFPRLGKPLALLALWVVGSVFALPFITGLQPDPLGPPSAAIMAWLPTALWIGWMALAAL